MFVALELDDIISNISYNSANILDCTYYDTKQVFGLHEWETLENLYSDIFNSLSDSYRNFVCSSEDIHEELEYGDYDYYLFYTIMSLTPVLYMKPSHNEAFPNKLIIFGEWYIANISDDKETVLVQPSDISSSITHHMEDDIIMFKEYLANSDRESLIEKSEWK